MLTRIYNSFLYSIWYRKLGVKIGRKCSIGRNVKFEGMNVLYNNVSLCKSSLGYASYINARSNIKNTSIGRYTSIASDVKTIIAIHPVRTFVSTHPCFYSLHKQSGFTYVQENLFSEKKMLDEDKAVSVIIGNDVWIGERVIILPGLKIGHGAIVGAGAVIVKDVEPYSIVAGVPARIRGYRFTPEEIEFLLQLKWWNKDREWIKKNSIYFRDIKKISEKFSDA